MSGSYGKAGRSQSARSWPSAKSRYTAPTRGSIGKGWGGMAEARFGFGENWKRFAASVTETEIGEARRDLQRLFGEQGLRGRRFLDIGSGSGLHSLAAHCLGAATVQSFDYDVESVECTLAMRSRAGDPASWTVQQGSVLDAGFLETLPECDLVYSWGVLHHTGDMWQAISNAASLCKQPDSQLCIGIYHRKFLLSPIAKRIKLVYVTSPSPIKRMILFAYWVPTVLWGLLRRRHPLREIREYGSKRGMDYWRDLEDWVGGYPFECARVDEVLAFVLPMGFDLSSLRARHSVNGVNVFVFRRRV